MLMLLSQHQHACILFSLNCVPAMWCFHVNSDEFVFSISQFQTFFFRPHSQACFSHCECGMLLWHARKTPPAEMRSAEIFITASLGRGKLRMWSIFRNELPDGVGAVYPQCLVNMIVGYSGIIAHKGSWAFVCRQPAKLSAGTLSSVAQLVL